MKQSSGRRAFPYYKVQVRNDVSLTWKDARGAFDEIEEAEAYVSTKLGGATARIMVVDAEGRRPLK